MGVPWCQAVAACKKMDGAIIPDYHPGKDHQACPDTAALGFSARIAELLHLKRSPPHHYMPRMPRRTHCRLGLDGMHGHMCMYAAKEFPKEIWLAYCS